MPPTDASPALVRLGRRLARWAYLLTIALLGAVFVLTWLENWLVYKPAGPNEWQPPPDPAIQDVALTAADGTALHAWWYPRAGSSGAVLYLHGNAGNLSWRGNSLINLRQLLQEPVLIVDYPGYGKSQGKPTEAGCYAAADAAYDWLTTVQNIPGENILLYGASLGGGVAVDLASRKPHRALILVKTFTTMPEVGQRMLPFLPVHWLMTNHYDSLGKLPLCKGPIFIAHGDADDLVPFAHGERLFEAAVGPKEFLRLPGAEHNDALPPLFFEKLGRFLAQTAPLPASN
jgi:uncharacterized protein